MAMLEGDIPECNEQETTQTPVKIGVYGVVSIPDVFWAKSETIVGELPIKLRVKLG